MTAPSKTWTAITDAAVAPDAPLTTGLLTALRDNATVVYEWLGASYAGGIAQDHNHDGVNSALVEVGPNLVRNGSFESGATSWTFSDYAGGAHADETANDMHGAKSMSFTSTVLANGGGQAISDQFIPVSEYLPLYVYSAYLKASVANVSARLELVWYDDTQSQISADAVIDLTATPTSATRYVGNQAPPSGARYLKVRITGGVPAAGSAAGTVYFDGIAIGVPVEYGQINAGAVGQSEIKSTTGSVSGLSGNYTLPGGEYGLWVNVRHQVAGNTASWGGGSTTGTSFINRVSLSSSHGSYVAYVQQRYFQASPPYDLGDGEIPLFVFAALGAGGEILGTYVAQDPPWANNGPTNVRPDYYRNGRGYQRVKQAALDRAMLRDPATRAEYLAALRGGKVIEREVTQAIKQADMALVPHPFEGIPGMVKVALLDPVSALALDLREIQASGDDVSEILHGYISLDNVPIARRATPPGVIALAGSWNNNGG